jgi:hypothetical protein
MTVSLTTLYNRLGGHFGIAKTQLDARSGIVTRATNLDAQYTAATRYMFTPVLNQFLGIYNSTDATITTAVQGATKTLTEMVTADNANIPKSTIPAMRELARQMRAGSTTLLENTVTIGGVSRTGTGTGTIVFGTASQMSRTDLLQFECISDTTTGATAGSEVFRVTGSAAYNNINDSLWPGGTGLSTTMASNDYTAGTNLINNGTFETWVGGLPDGWTILSNSTMISQLTSGAMRGSSALKISSNSVKTEIKQTIPTQALGPGKRVIFGFWYKKLAGTATRDITMELEDNTSGAAASAGVSPTATSWTLVYSSYRSSFDAPVTALYATFFAEDTTASGLEVAIDGMFVYVPAQAGTNGQFFQIISGATDWRIGDRMTVQVTNNYASTVLSYTERFFAPFANGVELPTTASGTPPTVTNSVIP